MNLQNLGVQEMNAKEVISVDGGWIDWIDFMNGDPEGFAYLEQAGYNFIAGAANLNIAAVNVFTTWWNS